MITRSRFLPAAALALWVALPACGDAGAPTPTEPGTLGLQIVDGAPRGAGAFTATVTARPGHTIALGGAQPSYRVLARVVSDREIRLLAVGPLRQGAILAFHVPDLNDSTAYSVHLVELADSTGALLSPDVYRLALVPLRR